MSDYTQNLVSLLVGHAQQRPEATALRHKQFGLWQSWSWQRLLALSESYASALAQQQFQQQQSLLILSSPNVDVVAISLAVQALQGQLLLLDQELDRFDHDQLLGHLNTLQPDYLLIEHDRVLQGLNYQPRAIFYIEDQHPDANAQPFCLPVSQLLAQHQLEAAIHFGQLQLAPSQLAFGFYKIESAHRYTVNYSHHDLVTAAQDLIQIHHLEPDDVAFVARAFSSVGHIRYLWPAWLAAGFSLNIPETLQTRDLDRQEIAPSVVLGTAATYSRVAHNMLERLPRQGSVLDKIYQSTLVNIQQKQPLTLVQRLLRRVLRQVILDELGLSRLKTALIVGQPLDSSSVLFYQFLGIDLQPWGQAAQWQTTLESLDQKTFGSELTTP
jgi:long-chain acyl-CoA synthetase